MIYEFDEIEVDLDRYELRGAGRRVHVERQVFDVLVYLLAHRDRVVPKEELLDNVWGDRFVSESALTSRVMAARKAVNDTGTAQRVIRTAFGRGYQFVAEVRTRDLYGAYGRGRLVRATGDEAVAEAALDVELARVGWGRDDPSFRQVFTSQFLPGGTREQWNDLNELQRRTTSAANAARFIETFARIDVTDGRRASSARR